MENTYTKIISILDRSGSMSSMVNSAIEGYNEYIEGQRLVEGKANITSILFDNEILILDNNTDIKNCNLLNRQNYVPRSSTSLYDAIGEAIDNEIDLLSKMPKSERPEQTLCVILTDGEENSSKKYNSTKIKEMINEMKNDYNWEFIFLAANQDAFAVSDTLGISKGNTLNFSYSDRGFSDTYSTLSKVSSSYRTKSFKNKSSLIDELGNENV